MALVGYMQRDLVERPRWIDDEEYKHGLALAQIMPGPLAAQLAIASATSTTACSGATLVGLAFVLPSFLMVLALSALYVAYGGLWWMQAVFYGVGRRSSASSPSRLQAGAQDQRARPAAVGHLRGPVRRHRRGAGGAGRVLPPGGAARAARQGAAAVAALPLADLRPLAPARSWPRRPRRGCRRRGATSVLWEILLFFTKAGAFVFGSGLAIVPFLYEGVVREFGWLTEQQFLDAVAVAMITPGPVVITVAFIGYLVAGVPGATLAAIGIFLPVWVLTVIPAPWFRRHRNNAQLRAFSDGATAAASGAIAGAVVVLGQRAIVDIPTAAIALASLGALWRFKCPSRCSCWRPARSGSRSGRWSGRSC